MRSVSRAARPGEDGLDGALAALAGAVTLLNPQIAEDSGKRAGGFERARTMYACAERALGQFADHLFSLLLADDGSGGRW